MRHDRITADAHRTARAAKNMLTATMVFVGVLTLSTAIRACAKPCECRLVPASALPAERPLGDLDDDRSVRLPEYP